MGRLIALFIGVFLLACASPDLEPAGSNVDIPQVPAKDSVELTNSTFEYKLKYASGFAIQGYKGNTHVIIFDEGERVGEYMLYKGEEPEAIPGVQNVKVPISNIACLSTTYLPFISKLDKISSVSGVANAQFVKNSFVKLQLQNGVTQNISAAEEIDIEKVVELNSDILMVYPFNRPDYSRLQKMGVNLFYNTEYKESHPLGQAEWIKLFGLLYGKEVEAQTIFNEIETSYMEAMKLAENSPKVKVMAGTIFNDKWSAPGGKSMGAKLILDAGGEFIWNDDKAGSYEKDVESVIEDSQNAEVMALISGFEGEFSKDELKADNSKYGLMGPFTNGTVIHCNTAQVSYFEDALLEPDVVLKDLVHLFHPELLTDHNLKYFRPLN